jgi:nucleoside-diphosphate-sugar epimerase
MKRILITGGNGYIGKAMYNAFKDKYDVTTITRSYLNLLDKENVDSFFEGQFFDVVIHTAVVGGSRLKTDETDVLDQNLIMYYNLLSNREHYNQFIHFGSGAMYTKSDEPYGLSKKAINLSIAGQPNFYDLIVYGVFDENELDTRFIKASILNYINKQPIVIHENKVMTFFYMPDLVKLVDFIINDKDNDCKGTILHCAYRRELPLFHIAVFINNYLDSYQVPINIENKTIKEINNYKSPFGEPYGLDYIGLEQGIKNVYNKLKNEL